MFRVIEVDLEGKNVVFSSRLQDMFVTLVAVPIVTLYLVVLMKCSEITFPKFPSFFLRFLGIRLHCMDLCLCARK